MEQDERNLARGSFPAEARMTAPPRPSAARSRESRAAASESEIYRCVYDAIVQHHLPPGTKLNEGTLAETFMVSRATIRPILARLAHEGVVELHPNRGAFVAKPSPRIARDLFEVRRILECAIVARMAPVLDDASIQELERLVGEELAARERNMPETGLRLSGEFHLKLAEFSGNEVYREILKELISRTSLAIALYQAPGKSGCRCNDHQKLVGCLAARNGAAASAVMAEHLDCLQDGLNLEIEEPRPLDLKSILSRVRSGRSE